MLLTYSVLSTTQPPTLVRKETVQRQAAATVGCRSGADMLLPPAPNPCRSSTARPRRHSKTSYSACPVASGLLQRHAGRSSSFHTSTVPASPARTVLDLKPRDRVTPVFKSCTGYQSPRGSSTSCACWFTSRFWDTCRNTSRTS